MSLQVGSLVETLVANWALMRRFFHMQDFVHRQSPRLAETFPTLGALKWFLLRVDISVKQKFKIK